MTTKVYANSDYGCTTSGGREHVIMVFECVKCKKIKEYYKADAGYIVSISGGFTPRCPVCRENMLKSHEYKSHEGCLF